MKVTPCSGCPCVNITDTNIRCNLGYKIGIFWTIDCTGFIEGSKNCELKEIKYGNGLFLKPVAVKARD